MKKFPVVSENGTEYYVKIVKWIDYNSYRVYVYKKFKVLGVRFNSLQNEHFMGHPRSYNAQNFEYDFVRMAKYEIKRMETQLAEDNERELLSKQGYEKGNKKFNEWDGKC